MSNKITPPDLKGYLETAGYALYTQKSHSTAAEGEMLWLNEWYFDTEPDKSSWRPNTNIFRKGPMGLTATGSGNSHHSTTPTPGLFL